MGILAVELPHRRATATQRRQCLRLAAQARVLTAAGPLTRSPRMPLVWLERHVRRPLENSLPDRVLFSPAKAAYCRLRRQD